MIVTNGPAIAAQLQAEAAAVGPRLETTMIELRHEVAEAWQAGINSKTGATAATIGVDRTSVGSDAPHIHRLEVGFHGADSLGRVYDQAGDPALGPAFDLVVPQLEPRIDARLAARL
jgi:hypothetical protein